MKSHFLKLSLSVKDLFFFQFITHWVRVSMSTREFVKTVGIWVMGILDEAVVPVRKVEHTCLSSVVHLITLLRV